MINRKIIFPLILLFLTNCSFDSKTGIWGGSEKEKIRISELEKKQKQIIEIEKVYSSDNIYEKEKKLSREINLSNATNILSWKETNLNAQNLLGNIYLPSKNNIFFKKKIGKDKFPYNKSTTSLLVFDKFIILSDDNGTIFNVNRSGKINWKKNVYQKFYKRVYKNLVFSIYENNIYVADNIGFVYSIDYLSGQINWIKNYGVPIKSDIKIHNGKIFLIDQDNKIFALDTNDGAQMWDVLSISSFIKSQNLLSLSLSKSGDLFAITSSADVFKIETSTGNIIWSRNTAESLLKDATDFFTSSQIVYINDQIIFSSGKSIFSFDVNDGNTIWTSEISSVDTPIVDKNNIFIITENGYFAVLSKDSGEIISSTNILKVLKKKKQNTQVTSFIMGSEKIYSLTSNGFLIVVSAKTGNIENFKKIGEPSRSRLIISGGELFFLTESSKIIGFR